MAAEKRKHVFGTACTARIHSNERDHRFCRGCWQQHVAVVLLKVVADQNDSKKVNLNPDSCRSTEDVQELKLHLPKRFQHSGVEYERVDQEDQQDPQDQVVTYRRL